MINLDRIRAMNSTQFLEFMEMYRTNSLRAYIDWEGYLFSEDNNPYNFVKYMALGRIIPSSYEMMAQDNEFYIAHNRHMTESEKKTYIDRYSRIVKIIEMKQIMGSKYYTVADAELRNVMNVPCENINILE